ncbi:MAG: biopolymer transporter ExbD [Planctomycetota bacterium]
MERSTRRARDGSLTRHAVGLATEETMPSGKRSHEEVTINLTPMIDVVFLLVIFFMVGSKFSESESSVNVNVPANSASAMSRKPDTRIIDVAADGSVLLDQTPLSLEQLTATLQQQYDAYPGLQVAVRGEGTSSFQRVFEVMQLVGRIGIKLDVAAKIDRGGGGRLR